MGVLKRVQGALNRVRGEAADGVGDGIIAPPGGDDITYAPIDVGFDFKGFGGSGAITAAGINNRTPLKVTAEFRVDAANGNKQICNAANSSLSIRIAATTGVVIISVGGSGLVSFATLVATVGVQYRLELDTPGAGAGLTTVTLYDLDNKTTTVETGTLAATTSTNQLLTIGAVPGFGGANFNGILSELKIYENGTDTLDYHWPMDEDTGSTLNDAAGGADATIQANSGVWFPSGTAA